MKVEARAGEGGEEGVERERGVRSRGEGAEEKKRGCG